MKSPFKDVSHRVKMWYQFVLKMRSNWFSFNLQVGYLPDMSENALEQTGHVFLLNSLINTRAYTGFESCYRCTIYMNTISTHGVFISSGRQGWWMIWPNGIAVIAPVAYTTIFRFKFHIIVIDINELTQNALHKKNKCIPQSR